MRNEQFTTQQKVNVINTADRIQEFIAMNICYWCNQRSLSLEENVTFTANPKWKIDWCIPSIKLAILFEKHKDIVTAAEKAGWKIIPLNQSNYKSLFTKLNQVYGANN